MTPLETQIDDFWDAVRNSYDIEDREYFEKKYPESPLAMAVHYMWKRDVFERTRDAKPQMWTGILRGPEEVRDSEDLDDGC